MQLRIPGFPGMITQELHAPVAAGKGGHVSRLIAAEAACIKLDVKHLGSSVIFGVSGNHPECCGCSVVPSADDGAARSRAYSCEKSRDQHWPPVMRKWPHRV